MPGAAEPLPPSDDLRWTARWEVALAVALGVALLGFGWADTRSFLASRHKAPFTFSLNALPGGLRIGSDEQEIFRDAFGDYARLENFGFLEHQGSETFRHNLGPVSRLEIVAAHATWAQLSFRYVSIVDDQDFTVACNGETLEELPHLTRQELFRRYRLPLRAGRSVVTFTCRPFNHDGTLEAPGDPRPIAGTFAALDVWLQ